MKRLFTCFLVFLGLVVTSYVHAQDHTYTVPGDYNHVVQAMIQGIKNNADVVDGQEILINVLAGESSEEGYFTEMPKAVKIVIQGAGTDSTILSSRFDNKRWMHFASNTAEGVEIVVKDLTLRKFGNPDGSLGGGLINLQKEGLKLTMTNVVFDSIQSARGAIIQAFRNDQIVTLENCFFTQSTIINGGGLPAAGLIYKEGSGNVLIKNSTFMTNYAQIFDVTDPLNPFDPAQRRGRILDIVADSALTLNVTLEDNAIIHNRVVDSASTDSIQTAVSIRAKFYSDLTVQMTNNIFIENGREGAQKDVDIYIENADSITFIAADNIANAMLNRQLPTDDIPVDTIVELDLDGFKVKPEYTFTHEDIVFTMDGELPKLLEDEFGVPYVEYSGDGGLAEPIMVSGITIFSLTNVDSVEVGSTLQLVASIAPTDATDKTVSWSVINGTGSATIDETGTLTAVSEGMVTVLATANDGSEIEGTKEIKVFTTSTVDIKSNDIHNVFVYPNPTEGIVSIQLPSDVKQSVYHIYNTLGELIQEGIVTNSHKQIDMSQSPDGLYIMKIDVNDKQVIERIVIR